MFNLASGRNRTRYHRFTKPPLYLLSYAGENLLQVSGDIPYRERPHGEGHDTYEVPVFIRHPQPNRINCNHRRNLSFTSATNAAKPPCAVSCPLWVRY